ncbi:GyrI-like domain-containing protein [Marinomonas posidonica]|uniref:GyrI-like domain-containing protein n=1 Tax=Marinomonas posidonica TaxID=936476 RepID=UPI003736FC6D
MELIQFDTIQVAGLSVRTTNDAEMTPDTAKISALWAKFYGDLSPMLDPHSRVFGLYTHYESDHTGAFDVVACADSLTGKNLEEHQIPAGNYVKFQHTGEMPQAVIDLWGEVWAYFASEKCAHTRAFTTDFECYKSEQEVEIYIAVK